MNSHEQPFFLRNPWVYNPKQKATPPPDAQLGFDTLALHAGFHPLEKCGAVQSFRAAHRPVDDLSLSPASTNSRITSMGAAKPPPSASWKIAWRRWKAAKAPSPQAQARRRCSTWSSPSPAPAITWLPRSISSAKATNRRLPFSPNAAMSNSASSGSSPTLKPGTV